MVQNASDELEGRVRGGGGRAAALPERGSTPGYRGSWRLAVLVTLVWGAAVGGLPLLAGPPNGDDAYYHAMYAVEHARCWRGGVSFPHWYPDLNGGLGGPEPRARPVLPLALHASLALLLGDAVAATSAATLLIPVAAGLLMLVAVRRSGGGASFAMVAAICWATSPYLFVTLHQRAALQEAWAVALLPWVMVSVLPPAPQGRRGVLQGAVAVALLSAVQLLVTFMVVVVAAVAHLARRSVWRAGAAGAAGLGLAAASWLPNVVALGRVQGTSFTRGWFDWQSHFLLVGGGTAPELRRYLGLVLLGAVAAGVAVLVGRSGGRFLAVGALATAALTTPLARPLYAVVPLFALLQFPWRWLSVGSCLAALAAARARGKTGVVALALLCAPLLFVTSLGDRLPSGPPLRPTATRGEITTAATRYGVPPMLPSFPAMLPRGCDLSAALAAGVEARKALPRPSAEGPGRWEWTVRRDRAATVTLPLLASDGWRATVNRRETEWSARDGLVAVPLPAGLATVRVEQVWLPEDLAGLVLSAVTALALLGWWSSDMRKLSWHRPRSRAGDGRDVSG